MYSRIAILFFILLYTTLGAQSKSICSKTDLLISFDKNERFNQAYTLFSQTDLNKAIPVIKELLEKADKTSDQTLKNYTKFLNAELLYENSSFQKSLDNYLELLEQENTTVDLRFFTLIGIGNIYIKAYKEFDRGISYFKMAEKLVSDNTCLNRKALLYSSLGHSYLIKEQYKESEDYYNLALKVHLSNNNENNIAGTYSNLANLFFEQYQDQKAENYFLKALTTFKTNDSSNIVMRQQVNENLSLLYEETNRPREAHKFLKASNKLKDSIWNRDKVWELAEIEKEFDIKQKQQEVDLLTTQNKLKSAQRNGLLISALILFTLLLTGIYFYKEKVKSAKIITAQKEDLDALNATKDKLFSIVSHDLRSSVNALKSSNKKLINTTAAKENTEISSLLNTNSTIVNGAYNLLDNLLNWALLQTKQSYFNIEQQRLHAITEHVVYNYKGLLEEKNITLTNTIPKTDVALVDKESLKIIIRNLLDNAIKFSKEGDTINIYSQESNSKFCDLIIQDSGMGIKEKTRLELEKDNVHLTKKENEHIIGTGLGLQLCKSLIKKNFGEFTIESTLGKGTKMIVSLPKPA